MSGVEDFLFPIKTGSVLSVSTICGYGKGTSREAVLNEAVFVEKEGNFAAKRRNGCFQGFRFVIAQRLMPRRV